MSDAEFRRFKKVLQNSGHFVTRPRMRLFGTLQNRPALTTKDLIRLVEKHDQATVYRNIALFEKLGIITRIQLGWHSRIELTDLFRHHHHHMTCLDCGKIIIIKNEDKLEKEISRLSNLAGFKALDHQLEIKGRCASCAEQEANKT